MRKWIWNKIDTTILYDRKLFQTGLFRAHTIFFVSNSSNSLEILTQYETQSDKVLSHLRKNVFILFLKQTDRSLGDTI